MSAVECHGGLPLSASDLLLDSKVRRALNINLASDVLIFDEAHNIERVCADAASFDLSSLELAGAVREVDRLLAGARNRSDDDSEAVDPEVDGLENANGGVRGGHGAGVAMARDNSESRHPAEWWTWRVTGRSTRPVTLIHATERVTRIHATLAFECRRRSTRPVP